MGARIQTWFPFTCYIYINGREWLSRKLDKANITYSKVENSFPYLIDFTKAQRYFNDQFNIVWPFRLDKIGKAINPLYKDFQEDNIPYYWTVYQSEWATDIVFESSEALHEVYTDFVREAFVVFNCKDAMKFLGKKLHGLFQGELSSDYKIRSEGLRLKHSAAGNSIKMYDKAGNILRVETTINNPYLFKIYRPKSGSAERENTCSLYSLRKSVADIYRRCKISNDSNHRYLDALAQVSTGRKVVDIVSPLCKPVIKNTKRFRAMRPWDAADKQLLKAISDGDYLINGFRNKDIRKKLFENSATKEESKKLSAKVSRYFSLLRAHGIIQKKPHTHRYDVTDRGREFIAAILKYEQLTCSGLNAA
jgi:hypothetical protein